MAVYVSAARRRRRAVLAAVVALVVGIVAGVLIGRTTASGVNDAVAASRRRGTQLVAQLQTLPFEYQAMTEHKPGKSQATFDDAVDRIEELLRSDLAKMPWVGVRAKASATAAMEQLRSRAGQHATQGDFTNAVNSTVATLSDTFALPASP